jgi:hypothetical protein
MTLASSWWQTPVWWYGGARRFRNGSDCESGWMRGRLLLEGASREDASRFREGRSVSGPRAAQVRRCGRMDAGPWGVYGE